jgi:hypothetical protein
MSNEVNYFIKNPNILILLIIYEYLKYGPFKKKTILLDNYDEF